MLKEAWLRNWLYHGQHLLYGVQDVSFALRTLPATAYSHEITGSVDAGVFLAMFIVFPVVAVTVTAMTALGRTGDAAAGQDDPRPGGGPPGPEPTPDLPADGHPAVTDDGADLAAGWPSPHEPGPSVALAGQPHPDGAVAWGGSGI